VETGKNTGVSFTEARFDDDEKMIITTYLSRLFVWHTKILSRGEFLIRWYIGKIQANVRKPYTAEDMKGPLVDTGFGGNDRDLIVARLRNLEIVDYKKDKEEDDKD
jgi:hypothetical protein